MTEAGIDFEEIADWFRTLYRDSKGYLHVASSGAWAGRFFDLRQGFNPAAIHVEALARTGTAGVYARVTTLRELPAGTHKRGGGSLTSSLPALWADVDLAGPNHKHVACPGGPDCQHTTVTGQRQHASPVLPLPPNEDAARAIVDDSRLPTPSLWIHSGGGLYPIWLISPVHQVADDLETLETVSQLSANWQRVIAASAERAGYDYGTGVGDLARVLRIPGTYNKKTADVQPCRIIEHRGQSYTLNDLFLALEQASDQLPLVVPAPAIREPGPERELGDVRPGDDFQNRVDWSDTLLLGQLGWTVVRSHGTYREWRREGAGSDLSATTGREGLDNLYVFSTETPFPTHVPISKLEAYRILNGYPDFKETVKALNRLGFGTPPVVRSALPPDEDPHVWPEGTVPVRPMPTTPNGAYVTVEAPPEPAKGERWVSFPGGEVERAVVLTPASNFRLRRVRWGWKDGNYGRCPVGEITLVPGREGVGKSMFLAWLAANLTRGTLPGEFFGQPRAVMYSTAEDSWEHTVLPRLLAAGADVDLVYRVETHAREIGRSKLVLPRDCRLTAMAAREIEAAAIMMDPIVSLIDDELSVNQSRQLRIALEPLRDAAESAQVMIIALAHFNKTSDVDVLSKIPGARAWVEVARAAIALAENSEDQTYVASQVKNNLGRKDLPHLTYTIEEVWLDTEEGPQTADTARLVWTGTSPTGADEVLDRKKSKPGESANSAVDDVVEFVIIRFNQTGHPVPTRDVIAALPNLSESAVRKAIDRALNRDGLLERPLHGHYRPASHTGGDMERN